METRLPTPNSSFNHRCYMIRSYIIVVSIAEVIGTTSYELGHNLGHLIMILQSIWCGLARECMYAIIYTF